MPSRALTRDDEMYAVDSRLEVPPLAVHVPIVVEFLGRTPFISAK